ncbi:MAG: DUF4249 domain-containing protein [Candidatus Cloacimonetes bacterium]|nr:DUF4249 domain-containing protein [Candidatus Cloacimonadota bacterium]
MKKIIILTAIILLLSGCELTAPQRYEKESLVVSGYLIAGKTVSIQHPIFVGRTISADGGTMDDILITNAEVKLMKLDINHVAQDTFALSFAIDIDNLLFGYQSEEVTIEPATTYRIEVHAILDSQDVFAWAETTVPETVEINIDYNGLATPEYGFADEFSPDLPAIPYDNVNNDFPIYFALNSDAILYTSYNFYCLEEFSTSLEYTIPFMNFTHLEEEDEEAYYSVMSNNLREVNMSWRYEPGQDDEGNWYRLDDFYAIGFSYYGQYRLTIYIVDQNYYTYHYHSESYLHGGIHGGIGYFGSVTGEDYFTRITR